MRLTSKTKFNLARADFAIGYILVDLESQGEQASKAAQIAIEIKKLLAEMSLEFQRRATQRQRKENPVGSDRIRQPS